MASVYRWHPADCALPFRAMNTQVAHLPMILQPVILWPGGAPGALGMTENDIPALTPYLPASGAATGAAMVVCPGGGYGGLASHEGHDYALFLNQHGIAAFVLRYRLGSSGYRHPCMLQDAARAVRTVRARAAEWGVDAGRVGVMGSSAGGHLAATLLTQFDVGRPDAGDAVERQSSRPDLGVLCYPVISMGENGHAGSRENLLGSSPSVDLARQLSAELNVTAQTPPCFVWHTVEDDGVKVENSLLFAAALRRCGVPFDLHLYERGCHGIGLADPTPFSNAHLWSHNLVYWLRQHGFL
jgi:acetyl esterase/lipase